MNSEIVKVIQLVKKESKKFTLPSVSEIALSKEPYKVLISCLLSLRTRDEVTLAASTRLFKLASTPEEMIKLDDKTIQQAIYPTGFYKRKTKTIKDISKTLIDNYDSKVPSSLDELLKLKGVGRKTANIVVVYGFDKPGMPIDAHCHRIPNRLGWIKTKTPEETEAKLREIIPKRYWKDFNDVFVAFGQNICKPIGPKCSICPVSSHCAYFKNIA
ncbi:MAG: endonuclease III [Nanoarchaeota archaeon]